MKQSGLGLRLRWASANEVTAKLMNPLFKVAPFLWRPLLTFPLPFIRLRFPFPSSRRRRLHFPFPFGLLFALRIRRGRLEVAPFHPSLSQQSPPPLSAEYPWQVAILKKEEFDNVYLCGGSLIDGSHIVTAAHCVDDFKPNELRWVTVLFWGEKSRATSQGKLWSYVVSGVKARRFVWVMEWGLQCTEGR